MIIVVLPGTIEKTTTCRYDCSYSVSNMNSIRKKQKDKKKSIRLVESIFIFPLIFRRGIRGIDVNIDNASQGCIDR